VSNFVQDGSAGSLEATFTAAVPILGCLRGTEIVEDGRFIYQKFASDAGGRNQEMF